MLTFLHSCFHFHLEFWKLGKFIVLQKEFENFKFFSYIFIMTGKVNKRTVVLLLLI